MERWIAKSGIQKHITFHCFRHTYATLQLTNGTDIYTVSKMLGHKKVSTTQIYAKIVDEKKEQATVNEALGTSRANFIADKLMQRGVPSSQITKRNHGGIDDYSPTEANRQTKVMLHIK